MKSKNPYSGWVDIGRMLDQVNADIEIAQRAGHGAVRQQFELVKDAGREWQLGWPRKPRCPCEGTPFLAAYIRLQEIISEMKPPKKPRTSQRGFVYFVSAIGVSVVKIGFAADVSMRLRSLQTGSATKLELLLSMPGTMKTEQEMHSRFARYRLEGEWFERSDAIMEFIQQRGEGK